MERVYNKLVRDNIPDIISEKGEIAVVRTLSKEEYKKELERKLYEEYKEVIEATKEDRIEELADMIEVIRVLASLEKKSLDDVILVADRKNEKRGSFSKKVFLEKVISNNN